MERDGDRLSTPAKTQATATEENFLINSKEFASVCDAIRNGDSLLITSEAGAGAEEFAMRLLEQFQGEFDVAIAVYKGSGKKFFQSLAEQLGVDVVEPKLNREGEAVGERSLTMDEIKDMLLDRMNGDTLLIFPEAKRLTTGVRYWLEDAMSSGVRVCCFAVVNPGRDIFLNMIEIQLELPGDRIIREEMKREAQRLGLQIDDSRLSKLQPLAGRNPQLARKVIRRERLGLNKEEPEHAQYLDISPIVLAVLAALSIIRFIGLGTGDRSLYIIGGIAMMVGMILKYLGRIRGSRKKYGQ